MNYLRRRKGTLQLLIPCLYGDAAYVEVALLDEASSLFHILSVPTESAFAYMDKIFAPWASKSLDAKEQTKAYMEARKNLYTLDFGYGRAAGLAQYLYERTYSPFVVIIRGDGAFFRGRRKSDEFAMACVKGDFATYIYVNMRVRTRKSVLPVSMEVPLLSKLSKWYLTNALLVSIKSIYR